MKGNFKVAVVRFIYTKADKYYSFALYDDFKIGDTVLCKVNHMSQYEIGEIIDIKNKEDFSGGVSSEIICSVNLAKYNERVERRKRKDQLRDKMNKMIKDGKELLYEALAKDNTEMKALLDEYKSIEL